MADTIWELCKHCTGDGIVTVSVDEGGVPTEGPCPKCNGDKVTVLYAIANTIEDAIGILIH